MSAAPLIPRRWRGAAGSANNVDALAAVVQTAPIQARGGGLAILVPLGAHSLLPGLVAIKTLHRAIGRGRVAIIDDGTLTAQDRAMLAHHCDDPEMLPAAHVHHGSMPTGLEWSALLTALDRRPSEYWILLDPYCLTLRPVEEAAEAIGRNRSHLMMTTSGSAGIGLAGFAAGGPGRSVATELYTHLCNRHSTARDLTRLLFESEIEPVHLPAATYCEAASDGWPASAKVVLFDRNAHAAHAQAAKSVIEDLPRG